MSADKAIQPLEWTAIDRYAVRTRSILTAARVAAELTSRRDRRAHGKRGGTEFMTLGLFERRLQLQEGGHGN